MIITCPACETRYNVADNTVAGRPRKVRCAKCSHEWVIGPPPEEAVAEAAPKAPAAAEQSAAPAAAPEAAAAPNEEAVRERPMRIRSDRRRPVRDLRPRRAAADAIGTLVLSAILLGGIAFAVIAWRVAIVRAVPMTAAFYGAIGIPVNALGIEIHQKDWQIAQQNGLPVLTINGTITNTSGRGVAVPPLELTLRDEKQRELYHWKVVLNAKHLSPGETEAFQIVQKSPPLEAHDVEIRFAPGA